MKLDLYRIDSFVSTEFKGNPACVIPLNNWLPDNILLEIAKRNAVAETAFFIYHNNKYHLRWFTPEIEMDLCGHATIAAAHCLKFILGFENEKIVFNTLSGELIVSFNQGYYSMNLPSRKPVKSKLPEIILKSLNIDPIETYKSRDYLLLYDNENQIRNIKVKKEFLDQINLGCGGVIVTSKGKNCDFVSRYFTPQSSILEDPVTGSSHCTLTPFWSKRLNKKSLSADQLSKRGGSLQCLDKGSRVIVSGQAKTFSKTTFVLK
jgi:PhzF family phenazine biosynthesis protein